MFRRAAPLLALLLLAPDALAKGKVVAPPVAEKAPVSDTYWGEVVTEDYRWLEDLADPKVKAWIDGQNAATRAAVDALPHTRMVQERVTQLLSGTSSDWGSLKAAGGRLFAVKKVPGRQQPLLVSLAESGDPASERVVLDVLALDKTGSTAMDWYVPSPDGRHVAVSLSTGGSEDGTLHIYDTTTGKALPDTIERVQYGTGGGSVAWAEGGRLFYTRYPAPGERPAGDEHFYQTVWMHTLGTPTTQDTLAVGREFPRIAEIALSATDDGKYVLANVLNGDGGEAAQWLWSGGSWQRISFFSSQVVDAQLGVDGHLYLHSVYRAPRGQILKTPLTSPNLDAATVVVPERAEAIAGFVATATKLYVAELDGGPSQLRVYAADGSSSLVPTAPVSSIQGLVRLGGDRILYRNAGYTFPAAWFAYEAGKQPVKTPLAVTPSVDWSDVEVVREFATSKDGTRVPMNILRKKGTVLDGTNPTVVSGYGGYGVSQSPGYRELLHAWLEQGGVWVITNLRGGGEYGEEWHRQGSLTAKQNVFDDFAACAQWLIDQKYTSSAKLAAMGGSNGGLLMGAFVTQHPGLARAVVSEVGIYDMLRVELSPNGAFNVTEFGTVKDEAQYRALRAYSPYHNVKDGTAYPAMMLTTGINDPRVEPSQSRKMAARLQAASTSGHPILLRTSFSAGHGMGSTLSETAALKADEFAFLAWQLGMDWKKIK